MLLSKQRVSEDRSLAKVRGCRGAKQEVIQVLLRACGKPEKRNAVQHPGVAAEVGGDAKMWDKIERSLGVPTVEVGAAQTAAEAQAAVKAVVVVQQGIPAKDCSTGGHVLTVLGQGNDE